MPESNERSVNLWPSIDFRSIRKFRMTKLFSLCVMHCIWIWCEANINKNSNGRMADNGKPIGSTMPTTHSNRHSEMGVNVWLEPNFQTRMQIQSIHMSTKYSRNIWRSAMAHFVRCKQCVRYGKLNWRKFVKRWWSIDQCLRLPSFTPFCIACRIIHSWCGMWQRLYSQWQAQIYVDRSTDNAGDLSAVRRVICSVHICWHSETWFPCSLQINYL